MELKQLEYFVHVVDTASFSRAALALNVAQSTLSRQIALLENETGQRLLVRTGRGAVPTAAGAGLLPHARTMLHVARVAGEELRDMHASPSGRITLGLPSVVALRIGVALVQQFRERFPRAVLSMSEGVSPQLTEWAIDGRLDLALVHNPLPSPQLTYLPIASEKMVLVAPASAAKLPRQIDLVSLAAYPMVVTSALNAVRDRVESVLKPRGIALQIVAEAGYVHTVFGLVASGVGYTILPEGALSLWEHADRLQWAPIGAPVIRNKLVLAVPKARPATRLTAGVIAILKALYRRQGP
jgi:LysR family nitrogen assimilation transcriptional regulator